MIQKKPKKKLNNSSSTSIRKKTLKSKSLMGLSRFAEPQLKKTVSTTDPLLHERHVHQVEFEMQNDKLQLALHTLKTSQIRYQELYEFSPVAYLWLNEQDLIIEANLTATQMLGIEKRLLINRSFFRFIAKHHQNIFYDHRHQAFAKKIKQVCELELIKKNGSPLHVHLESRPLDDSIEGSKRLQLALIDITDRINAVQALRASEEQFRSFIETIREWVWASDVEGHYTYNNPSVESIVGFSPKELLGRSYANLIHPDDVHFTYKILRTAIKTSSGWSEIIVRHRHKNGSYRYLESNAVPIIDSQGDLQGFRGTARDVTHRKKSEFQQVELNQAVKIGSLGELASGLAHELTQPLTAINNFTTGCIHRLESGNYQTHELLNVMKQAAQQAERAGQILHSIKDVVKKGRLHYETIDLHALIHETVSLIDKNTTYPSLKILLKLPSSPFYFTADRIQISLVLLNLIRNSLEAMTNITAIKKQMLVIQTRLVRNRLVKIRIKDTGPGFKKEITKKLFDPWFTTKPSGLGLGLAISRTIVEAHGGKLSAKTLPKGGACFEFFLPLNQKEVEDA